MKGIVMEINCSEAVVLSDDGSFSKIKNKDYAVGQAVIYKQIKKSRIVAFACAAAAAVVMTCGGFAYYTPTTYVSLDVNPSIAFSLNMFKRVLDVQPVNDDAKDILNDLHLKNESIDEAIQQTIDKLIQQGYITDTDNGGLIIAASDSSPASAQSLVDSLKEKAQQIIDEQGKVAEVDAEAVDNEQVQEAKALGVTPGKLVLVKKLQESSPNQDIDMNEWLNKPVKEINKAIQEDKATEKAKEENKNTNSTTSQNGKSQSASEEENSAVTKYQGNENEKENNDIKNSEGMKQQDSNTQANSQGEKNQNDDKNENNIQDNSNDKQTIKNNGNEADATTTVSTKSQSNENTKQNGNSNGKSNGHNK